jgi:uncharacterized protein (DUF2062 family)
MTDFQIICSIILGVFVGFNGYTLWITIQTMRWEKKRDEEFWRELKRREETEFLDIED